MGQFVNLTSQDGFVVPAWVAQPDGAPRGAVVVLQEIFGVNSHIRAVADRFAARGYLAVAPATFARVQPDVDLGYSEADMGVGFGFKTAVEALPGAGAMPDIQAAIDYAAQQGGGKVGIVGFCWGGAAHMARGLQPQGFVGGGVLLRWRHDHGRRGGAPAPGAGAGAFWPARPLDFGGQRAGLCARASRGAGACVRRRPRLQLRPARVV